MQRLVTDAARGVNSREQTLSGFAVANHVHTRVDDIVRHIDRVGSLIEAAGETSAAQADGIAQLAATPERVTRFTRATHGTIRIAGFGGSAECRGR